MVETSPIRLLLSPREQQALSAFLRKHASDKPATSNGEKELPVSQERDSFNLASVRSAARVYVATSLSLKLVGVVLDKVAQRSQRKTGKVAPRPSYVTARNRLALSLSSLLFFHRTLYRLFSKLRIQLLHEKVQAIRNRYPKLYALLTSKLAPAVGASLSGLALGIFPSDQLRVTITIYVACRALETLYSVLTARGLTRNNPFGHWLIFALAQGQLLHAFVFDPDCFPESYSTLILANTPEYIQRRPANLSRKVTWPTSKQIVDSLAEMARLRWPPFISPILRPNNSSPAVGLPSSINPIIHPITSRAHPSLTNLSCALIHPDQTSCFIAYVRQLLLSFPNILRFFTLYYSLISFVTGPQKFFPATKNMFPHLNRLAQQIFKTTSAVVGAIGLSWGSICLFQHLLPRKLFPQFRFFLGGLLGGMCQLIDSNTAAGYANSMYAARTSVDSLWKVGVKRRWWRPVKGGDVWVFVAALAVLNVCFDVGGDKVRKERIGGLIKVLRGDTDVGMQRRGKGAAESVKEEAVLRAGEGEGKEDKLE